MVLEPVFAAALASLAIAAEGGGACRESLDVLVMDADLGTPLAGAGLSSPALPEVHFTGPEGRVRLTGLCPGTLRLGVSKAGFAESGVQVDLPRAEPLVIRLAFPVQSLTIVAPELDPLADLGFSDTLDGEALARSRGLGLADALADVQGVQVLRSGAVAKPVIDGFAGNRILILNDGVRHQAQLWALDHAPEIDPFGAHRLRVIRGAEGVRYGADGIGGVISVEPRPHLDPDTPGWAGEVDLVGISNGAAGHLNAALVGTVPGLPRLAVRVQGSAKKAGASIAPHYALDNTGAEDFSGVVSARYLGEGWMATVGLSHLEQTYGVFTGVRAEAFRDFERVIDAGVPPDVELYGFDYDIDRAFSRVRHTFLRAELSAESALGTLRALYGFQDNNRREFENTRRPTELAQLLFDLESHNLELSLEHTLGAQLSGVLGVSGLLQTNDHEGRRLIPDYERRTLGVFGVERFTAEALSVSAGFRYERQGLDTEQPARIGPNSNPPERASLDFEAVQATLAFGLEPHPAWTLDLHLATAVRIPTIDELFLDGLLPGEIWVAEGDRGLRPEKTVNAGTAVAFSSAWLDVEVTAFVHRIADYIYRAPELSADDDVRFRLLITGRHPALAFRNIDALQAGGSAEAVARPLPGLSLRVRGSWVRGRDLSRGAPLFNIPPDRYAARASYAPGALGPVEDGEVWLEGTYVARQSDIDPAVELAEPPPAYLLVHAGVSGHIPLDASEVRVGLSVHNLLNTTYRDYLSRLRYFADEPGISAILRVQLAFDLTVAASRPFPTETTT